MRSKKNIKRVVKAIVKEKDEASPSITKEVLQFDKFDDGLIRLAVPFTKKMKNR